MVTAALRDAVSDDEACLCTGCELGFTGLTGVSFPDFFSVVLDVDEVLDRLVDVIVLRDVEVTFVDSLSVLPLLGVSAGISISCTLTGVLDLDLTALPLFTEADLGTKLDLLEDDGSVPFDCRPDPDQAASFVRLTNDGLFTFFCPTEGINISCTVDGVRDLARLVVYDGDVTGDSAILTDLSLLSLFSAVVVRCSDDDDDGNDVSLTLADDISSIASTLLCASTEPTASAAAAAAA